MSGRWVRVDLHSDEFELWVSERGREDWGWSLKRRLPADGISHVGDGWSTSERSALVAAFSAALAWHDETAT